MLDSLPENDGACGELLLELADYLPKRYPALFRREGADDIVNLVTEERHVSISSKKGVDALRVVSRCAISLCYRWTRLTGRPHSLVQDDFLMAREREDGQIYLVGGLIAFPG